MRRKDREMPAEFGLEVADSCEYGTVAMLDTEGKPYIVALSLIRDGNRLYFHSAMEGKKTDCLRKNPRVAVSFVGKTELVPDKFTTKYASAVMYGSAHEITSDEEKIGVLKLLCQKLAPQNLDAFDAAIARSLARTAIWCIDVDEVTAKAKR